MKDRPYTDNKMPLAVEINRLLTKKWSQFNKLRMSMIHTDKEECFEERFITNTAQLIKQEFDIFKNADSYED